MAYNKNVQVIDLLIVLILYAELDDYLDLARAGPALSDEQHIYHKLIFDAVNEAINECIVDVRCSTLKAWSRLQSLSGSSCIQDVQFAMRCRLSACC